MLRSMYSGISGMKNFQTKLDVIGNNIANVNTYGFKKGRVTFKDSMNQMISGASAGTNTRGGKNPIQVGLGSTLATIDLIDTQSSLQTTGRALDLAIDGDGYFMLKQGEQTYYSRAGNFYLDNTGTLVNADGLKLQQLNNGKLEDIKVDVNSVLPAEKTTKLDITGNFPKVNGAPIEQTKQIEVVDDKGEKHVVTLTARSEKAGEWTFTYEDKSIKDPTKRAVVKVTNLGEQNQTIQYGSESYDTAKKEWKGDFVLDGSGKIPLLIADKDGKANPYPINFNLKNITTDKDNLNASFEPDGNLQGAIESFSIGADGKINAVYSNGKAVELGTLALAKFSNPAGLLKAGNNLFQDTVNSGTPSYGVPGEGVGSIAPGALEMSNVDLSEEFTEMIVAQRGFQANTRIITTSDEILQELINLKR